MMAALSTYLEEELGKTVHIDNMPDQPVECSAVFLWNHTVGRMNDGSGTRYIQYRVRSSDYNKAMAEAKRVANLLDSGLDERLIPLPYDGAVIGRVRRMPIVLNRDPKAVTVYTEIAMIGLN